MRRISGESARSAASMSMSRRSRWRTSAACKATGIGTYQCFQETYHRETYAKVHTRGARADYDWRATVMDRAMEAGIDDVGIGRSSGIYDWRFELLAMLQHITHLEDRFGCGPHTISVPRLEPPPARTSPRPRRGRVKDNDFLKLMAILRLAVPYTGMIMSHASLRSDPPQELPDRHLADLRGSRTDPGGYEREQGDFQSSQFAVGDNRPLDQVVREIAAMGFTPSFCTACYRTGRTGSDFMDIAKPGAIKYHCEPNALATFTEYLEDYASPATEQIGEAPQQPVPLARHPAAAHRKAHGRLGSRGQTRRLRLARNQTPTQRMPPCITMKSSHWLREEDPLPFRSSSRRPMKPAAFTLAMPSICAASSKSPATASAIASTADSAPTAPSSAIA